jgi:hypothetical protein
MNPHIAEIYFEEMDNHARWSLEAFARMRKAETAPDRFAAAHQALGHAAIVSRFLWPEEMITPKGTAKARRQHKRAVERGNALRQQLELPSEHPLNRRDLRIHMVMFESRIDGWIAEDLDNIVRPTGSDSMRQKGPVAEDVMRYLDAEDGVFELRGTGFNLAEIADSLEDLRGRIALIASKEIGLASGSLL